MRLVPNLPEIKHCSVYRMVEVDVANMSRVPSPLGARKGFAKHMEGAKVVDTRDVQSLPEVQQGFASCMEGASVVSMTVAQSQLEVVPIIVLHMGEASVANTTVVTNVLKAEQTCALRTEGYYLARLMVV
mmetsp:Transcript_25078/g.47387  ORF Transcript_25078/g.47387 Transcript_25078/m.47387 type:complete len:130 (-) Transcript_25078:205-594(-)|eukprot:CAMPEP_0114247966 /NCGR_PEP_ID=MMETSP0058-20121206/13310_1 /TAXON_ID=36894 /ORGANISM="Pyramimonas parkeae, CCMP726" /LENGTH=129 /DNA_ID=CAMNT_0001361319 /DNA_START=492 /DNA_END=881 /DNA_ORIENTATION=+